jgi:hypothetical protein
MIYYVTAILETLFYLAFGVICAYLSPLILQKIGAWLERRKTHKITLPKAKTNLGETNQLTIEPEATKPAKPVEQLLLLNPKTADYKPDNYKYYHSQDGKIVFYRPTKKPYKKRSTKKKEIFKKL